MASDQLPFIIGVIREKEKSLLEADEYTRLIDDIVRGDTQGPLRDTAYGLYLAGDLTPPQALDARLYEEFTWLKNMLGNNNPALVYIAARYDALHIANALMGLQAGEKTARAATRLGLLSAELLTSTLWRNHGWEDVPALWRTFMQEQLENMKNDSWSRQDLLQATSKQYYVVLEKTGTSALAKTLTALANERADIETSIRPSNLPEDLVAYEKQWDEKTLAAIRPYRAEPTSVDAVIAWWYALAIEVKTLRLLLLSAGGKADKQTLQNIERSLYRAWV